MVFFHRNLLADLSHLRFLGTTHINHWTVVIAALISISWRFIPNKSLGWSRLRCCWLHWWRCYCWWLGSTLSTRSPTVVVLLIPNPLIIILMLHHRHPPTRRRSLGLLGWEDYYQLIIKTIIQLFGLASYLSFVNQPVPFQFNEPQADLSFSKLN